MTSTGQSLHFLVKRLPVVQFCAFLNPESRNVFVGTGSVDPRPERPYFLVGNRFFQNPLDDFQVVRVYVDFHVSDFREEF